MISTSGIQSNKGKKTQRNRARVVCQMAHTDHEQKRERRAKAYTRSGKKRHFFGITIDTKDPAYADDEKERREGTREARPPSPRGAFGILVVAALDLGVERTNYDGTHRLVRLVSSFLLLIVWHRRPGCGKKGLLACPHGKPPPPSLSPQCCSSGQCLVVLVRVVPSEDEEGVRLGRYDRRRRQKKRFVEQFWCAA